MNEHNLRAMNWNPKTTGKGVRVVVYDAPIPEMDGVIRLGEHKSHNFHGVADNWILNTLAPEAVQYAIPNKYDDWGLSGTLKWSLENDIDVISISMGIWPSDEEKQLLEQAYNKGIIIVVAAGNFGEEHMSFLAKNPYTITVGNYDAERGEMDPSSSWGNVDIVLPGHWWIPNSKGNWIPMIGSSQATPAGAAIATHWKEIYSEGAERFREFLKGNSKSVGPPDQSGWGLFVWPENWPERKDNVRTFSTIKDVETLSIGRNITKLHLHHTATLKTEFVGEPSIRAMYHYQTATKGWDDIGYHFLIAPDGTIWQGRDINKDPASILNHNKGAIAIACIGNFNTEQLTGKQREVLVQFVASILKKTSLKTSDIILHRELSSTDCPGWNVNKNDLLTEIEAWQGYKKEILIGQVIDDEADVYLNGEFIGVAPIIKGVSYFPTRKGSEKQGYIVKWQPGRIDLIKEEL